MSMAEDLGPSGFGDFGDGMGEPMGHSLPAVSMDEEDDELEWRPRANPLPMLIAGAGALLVGASVGVGLAALLGSGLLSTPEAPTEAERFAADLEVVTVNLRGEDGDRVLTLRAQVAVRTTDPERVEMLVPALRDGVLLLASDHTAEEMLGASGRRRFRRELTERLDLLLGADRVEDVYFTELVVR